jgi:hypothetical protein
MAGPIKPGPLRLRFHAVGILAGPTACDQVRNLRGQRLLSLEAPRLPLIGCSCPQQCTCRFHHYPDRRAGPRRARERGMPGATWSTPDRRNARGRRDADFEDA